MTTLLLIEKVIIYGLANSIMFGWHCYEFIAYSLTIRTRDISFNDGRPSLRAGSAVCRPTCFRFPA